MIAPAAADLTRRRRRLFAAACAGIFVVGVVLAILGTIFGLPEMRDRLRVDLAQQGDVFLLLFLGILLSTIVVGPIIDAFGHKPAMTAGAVLVALSLALFSRAGSFADAGVAAVVLGLGGGALNTSSNALVVAIYSENRAAMLAILGAVFGVGALLIPLAAATLTGTFTIPELLLANAAVAAACALAFGAMSFPPGSGGDSFALLASIKAARLPGVLLFASLLFCQSGNEASVGGWTSTYVGMMGGAPRTATWVLAGYWAALMGGRLLTAWLQTRVGPARLVIVSGVGSAAGAAVLVASRSIGVMAVGAAMLGLAFAAVYPATLAIAADRYEERAGTVFGLLFAIALVGGMLFPWGVGHLSQAFGVRAGMLLPLAGGCVITALAAVIGKRGQPPF
jgi:fucose permease